MKSKSYGIFLLLINFPLSLFGQIKSTDSLFIQHVVPDSSIVDSIIVSDSVKFPKKLTRPVKTLLDYDTVIQVYSDSLSRWSLLNNFSEFLYWNEPNWTLRTPSFIRSSFVTSFQQIEPDFRVDGLSSRTPLGNQINVNLLPFNSLQDVRRDASGDYYLYTKRLHQAKPYTLIDAEETGFGYINVYGHLYIPLKKDKMLDFSLWNRSEDGEYANSSAQAKHFFVRYRHQLSDSRQLEYSVRYITNQMDEPDGYLVEPISLFGFDRFRTLARRNKAYSSFRNSLYRVDYFDEDARWFKHAIAYLNLNRRFAVAPQETPSADITMPADSIDLGYRELGLQTSSQFKALNAQLNYIVRASVIQSNQDSFVSQVDYALNGLTWFEFDMEAQVKRMFFGLNTRLDCSYALNTITGVTAKYIPEVVFQTRFGELAVRGNAQFLQQPVYSIKWQSSTLQGACLPATYHIGAGIVINKQRQIWGYETEFSAGYRSGDYAVSGGTFIVTQPYSIGTFRTDAFLKWGRWSLKNSFTGSFIRGSASFWGDDLRLWNRTSISFEDYYFKQAAFIKQAIHIGVSPLANQTVQYLWLTDDWTASINGEQIPGFIKVDYELIARVRQLFISFRWENLAQGLTQNGYFETYPNPMFSRRLRFGVKVYFVN